MNVWHVLGGVAVLAIAARLWADKKQIKVGQADVGATPLNEDQASINMGVTLAALGASSGRQTLQEDNPLQGVARNLGGFVGARLNEFLLIVDPSNPNTPIARQYHQATATLRPEDRVPERVLEGAITQGWEW